MQEQRDRHPDISLTDLLDRTAERAICLFGVGAHLVLASALGALLNWTLFPHLPSLGFPLAFVVACVNTVRFVLGLRWCRPARFGREWTATLAAVVTSVVGNGVLALALRGHGHAFGLTVLAVGLYGVQCTLEGKVLLLLYEPEPSFPPNPPRLAPPRASDPNIAV